jgi:SAM-dependent methyltransferase
LTGQTEVFKNYAHSYSALYQDKNYEAECDFLECVWKRFGERPVTRVLDLGCGAGGHVFPLASRGYEITGVDRSPVMLELAKEKAAKFSGRRPRLQVGDIQTLRLGETFDAIVCMFAVLSYQTSNDQLLSTLRTARQHLTRGSLFLCDFWYGPAVLKQQPADRIKEVMSGEDRIVRLARPSIDTQIHVVTVSYQLLRLRGNVLVEETREAHQMRYLFKPEMDLLMQLAGFELLHFCPFAQLDQDVSDETWSVSAIGRAI